MGSWEQEKDSLLQRFRSPEMETHGRKNESPAPKLLREVQGVPRPAAPSDTSRGQRSPEKPRSKAAWGQPF